MKWTLSSCPLWVHWVNLPNFLQISSHRLVHFNPPPPFTWYLLNSSWFGPRFCNTTNTELPPNGWMLYVWSFSASVAFVLAVVLLSPAQVNKTKISCDSVRHGVSLFGSPHHFFFVSPRRTATYSAVIGVGEFAASISIKQKNYTHRPRRPDILLYAYLRFA